MYKLAGEVLKDVIVRKRGVKASLYQHGKGSSGPLLPQCLALVTNTLQHRALIEGILKKPALKLLKGKSPRFVTMTMIYDYIRNGRILGGGRLKRDVIDALAAADVQPKSLPGAKGNDDRQPAVSKRFLRVDLHRCSVEDAITAIQSLEADATVEQDPILPDVVAVEPRLAAALRKHEFVTSGKLTMMDRAACLAGHMLGINPGDIVVDACAAPGSKTLHYLSLLRGQGLVIAIEADAARYAVLKRRVQTESLCTLVVSDEKECCLVASSDDKLRCAIVLGDFKKTKSCGRVEDACTCKKKQCLNGLIHRWYTAGELKNRQCLLSLDPSCSGSGLPEHAESLKKRDTKMIERVRTLAKFQSVLLDRAATLKCVTGGSYSTCSVWFEENEEVVAGFLERNANVTLRSSAVQGWRNSPVASVDAERQIGATKAKWWKTACRRADPATHGCRGFFVVAYQLTSAA